MASAQKVAYIELDKIMEKLPAFEESTLGG